MEDIITCNNCQTEFNAEGAKRNCSNCFACTGCIKYICPHCERVVIIKDVKKPTYKSNKNK